MGNKENRKIEFNWYPQGAQGAVKFYFRRRRETSKTNVASNYSKILANTTKLYERKGGI